MSAAKRSALAGLSSAMKSRMPAKSSSAIGFHSSWCIIASLARLYRCNTFIHAAHHVIMVHIRTRVVYRFLDLRFKPFVIRCRFMSFAHSFASLVLGVAGHGNSAKLSCIKHIKACYVQFTFQIIDASIKRLPKPWFIGALRTECFFLHANFEQYRPAARLPDNGSGTNRLCVYHAFCNGGVDGIFCGHDFLAAKKNKALWKYAYCRTICKQ